MGGSDTNQDYVAYYVMFLMWPGEYQAQNEVKCHSSQDAHLSCKLSKLLMCNLGLPFASVIVHTH